MKGQLIALDRFRGRQAAALVIDGQLDDLLIEPGPGAGPLPGAIYRATCDRPLKGQGGMILRLPDGAGFLRQGKGLSPGQPVLVQVTGHAEPGKAVPVTAKPVFKGRHVIVTPGAPGINLSRRIRDEDTRIRLMSAADTAAAEGAGFGIIIRSQAESADDDELADEVDLLTGLACTVMADLDGPPELLVDGPGPQDLAWREWPPSAPLDRDTGAFARHGVDGMISTFLTPQAVLRGGFSVFIEPTRALIAVDVNTGADTSPAAGLKANVEAARALPRQLRCRGLGGQIVVDFAPMPKKDRRQLETVLRTAFRADPVDTALVGWTPLGHFELQRKRERLPLSENLPGSLSGGLPE